MVDRLAYSSTLVEKLYFHRIFTEPCQFYCTGSHPLCISLGCEHWKLTFRFIAGKGLSINKISQEGEEGGQRKGYVIFLPLKCLKSISHHLIFTININIYSLCNLLLNLREIILKRLKRHCSWSIVIWTLLIYIWNYVINRQLIGAQDSGWTLLNYLQWFSKHNSIGNNFTVYKNWAN